ALAHRAAGSEGRGVAETTRFTEIRGAQPGAKATHGRGGVDSGSPRGGSARSTAGGSPPTWPDSSLYPRRLGVEPADHPGRPGAGRDGYTSSGEYAQGVGRWTGGSKADKGGKGVCGPTGRAVILSRLGPSRPRRRPMSPSRPTFCTSIGTLSTP